MILVRAVLLSVVVSLTTSAVVFAQSTSSVLSQTIAEDTYTGVERAVARGAVALWALGAIEEHGPHLPLSTDVEVPSAQLRGVKARLARAGIQAVIVPPYYWGVNRVTGDFAGSIDIRPEVMIELMLDVFRSLHRAGFREVYCITGHFDAAHGTAIAQAVRRANDDGVMRARFVVPAPLGQRLGLAQDDPRFILAAWPQVIGPAHADMTQAVSFYEGVLTVKVRNSTLHGLLSRYEKNRILTVLQQRFPKANIQNIVFRIG